MVNVLFAGTVEALVLIVTPALSLNVTGFGPSAVTPKINTWPTTGDDIADAISAADGRVNDSPDALVSKRYRKYLAN